MTRYRVYDIFTDRPFAGNPLAVVLDGAEVTEDAMQTIAAEFGLSETVFVLPPADPAHIARLRIFTPAAELPFAGHPLIGAAIALHDTGAPGEQIVEIGVGPIPLQAEGDRASFTREAAFEALGRPDAAEVAAALTLSPEAIRTAAHAPVIGGVGNPFCLVELDGAGALADARPYDAVFVEFDARYGTNALGLYAYIRDGDAIDARMFSPLDGIGEDPATGSAAAALAALLTDLDAADLAITITQGTAMGRPSRIDVTTARRDDAVAVAVTIAGQARLVMEGKLVALP